MWKVKFGSVFSLSEPWVYLYIGITSLCLYISTVFPKTQHGILYKLHHLLSCTSQILNTLTKHFLTFYPQLCYNDFVGRPCGCQACEALRRFFLAFSISIVYYVFEDLKQKGIVL